MPKPGMQSINKVNKINTNRLFEEKMLMISDLYVKWPTSNVWRLNGRLQEREFTAVAADQCVCACSPLSKELRRPSEPVDLPTNGKKGRKGSRKRWAVNLQTISTTDRKKMKWNGHTKRIRNQFRRMKSKSFTKSTFVDERFFMSI